MIGPEETPTHAFLQDVKRHYRARRPPLHPTVRDVVTRFLLPPDRDAVLGCQRAVLRLSHPEHAADALRLRRCKNVLCPACVHVEHALDARYLARVLESVSPARELSLYHVVWTLPPALARIVERDPRGLAAFREAAFRTLRHVFGIPSLRRARRELGMIANLHPWGDRGRDGEPWPSWHPHLDTLIPTWRVDTDAYGIEVVPLRRSWPRTFAATRALYREELRRALRPFCATLEETAILHEDFPVDLHVSWNPAQGGHVFTGAAAWHKVRYSCRPHFDLSCCHLELSEGGREVAGVVRAPDDPDLVRAARDDELTLVYTLRRESDTVVHLVRPVSFFSAVYRWSRFLRATKTTGYHGTLSRANYVWTCRYAGNSPAERRPKTGWRLAAEYAPDADGRYRPHGLWARTTDP